MFCSYGLVLDLKDDVAEPDFLRHLLTLERQNVWFSDGNTLGKLHFDEFDNLLCQVCSTRVSSMTAF